MPGVLAARNLFRTALNVLEGYYMELQYFCVEQKQHTRYSHSAAVDPTAATAVLPTRVKDNEQ